MAKKDQLRQFEQRQLDIKQKAAEAAKAAAETVTDTVDSPVAPSEVQDLPPMEPPAVVETPVVKAPVTVASSAPVSTETLAIQSAITQFIDKLRPNYAIHPDEGTNVQIQFGKALLRALENPDSSKSREHLNLFLEAFRAHATGCFSDSYLYRFTDSPRYRTAFSVHQGRLISRVLHALSVLGRVGFKDFEKLVSLKTLLSDVSSATVENNISAFFQRS